MSEKRPNLRVLIIIPILILVLAKGIPLVYTLFLSFQNYDMMRSSWVGFQNFAALFGDEVFIGALSNTFLYSLIAFVVGGLLSILSALLLSSTQSRAVRGFVLSLALLFSFLPVQFYTFLQSLSPDRANRNVYILQMLLINCLPAIGIAVLVGGAGACLAGKNGGALRFGGALLYVMLTFARLFSTNLDEFVTMTGPAYAGNTLYLNELRTGFLMFQMGQASAIRVVANLLQLLPAILALVLIMVLLRKKEETPAPAMSKAKLLPALPIALVLAVVFFGAAVVLSVGNMSWAEPSFLLSIFNSLGFVSVGGFFFCIMAIPAAAAGASFKKPVVSALFVLLSALSASVASEYLLTRSMGGVNTLLFPAFWAAVRLLPLIAFIAYFFYLSPKRAVWYSIPVLCLAFQSLFSNLVQPWAYLSDISKATIPLAIQQLMSTFSISPMMYGTLNRAIPYIVLALPCLALWVVASAFLFAAPVAEKAQDTPPAAEPWAQ